MGQGCGGCLIIPLPFCFAFCANCRKKKECKYDASAGNVESSLDGFGNVGSFLDGFGNLTLPGGYVVHIDNDGSVGFPNGQVFQLPASSGDEEDLSTWTPGPDVSALFNLDDYTIFIDNGAQGHTILDVGELLKLNAHHEASASLVHARSLDAIDTPDPVVNKLGACGLAVGLMLACLALFTVYSVIWKYLCNKRGPVHLQPVYITEVYGGKDEEDGKMEKH